MTTIAWDGLTLAADSLVTAGKDRWGSHRKLIKHKGRLIAFTGSIAGGLVLIEWFCEGAEPQEFPRLKSDEHAQLIVVADGKAWHYESRHIPSMCGVPSAWGTGREYALGAMAAGADARQAVRIAARFDALTGGRIIGAKARK